MGPGIFTKYSKQVIGGLLVLFVAIAAAFLYFQFRGPVVGVSPYENVNDFFEQEKILFTIESDAYPADVEVIQVTLRNDTDNTVVAPSLRQADEWLLETKIDGVWRSMRLDPKAAKEKVRWDFPAEECGANSRPSGIVNWNGGEQRYLCRIAEYYRTPLGSGTYRILFPEMEHRDTTALAVEFEVR